MYINAENPIVNKLVKNFVLKDLQYAETAYDYDNVIYKVEGFGDAKFVKFSFKSNCSKHIMANGGKEMLQNLYSDFLLPESEYDTMFDVSLKIDTSNMPKT